MVLYSHFLSPLFSAFIRPNYYSHKHEILFRPYQLTGVKRKCALVAFFLFCLDTIYRLAFQIFQISHSKLSRLQTLPGNAIFLISAIWQLYLIVNHLRALSNGRRVHLFLKMIMPSLLTFVRGIHITTFVYPWYNDANDKGKYMITLFSSLTGVIFKAKKATGIFQSENRLATITTNMCVQASSGVVGEFCLADKHCSKSSMLFWTDPKLTKPINFPESSNTRSFFRETSS